MNGKEDMDYGLIKGAAVKSGIAMAFAAAAGTAEAVMHHAAGNFTTLGEAFTYVAQPANLLVAAGLSIAAGTFIELAKRHNRNEDRAQSAPKNSTPPAPKK